MNRRDGLRQAAGSAIELAGVIGLMATGVLFVLVWLGWTEHYFWQAAAVAVLCHVLYLAYQLAQWLTSALPGGWRSWLLASLVPGVALTLTLLLAASNLGLVTLPGQTPVQPSAPAQAIQPPSSRNG